MRVFLSASAGTDTHILREALRELGAETLATTDVASGGGLSSVLQPTDRLIALLHDSQVGNTAVLVETGIAIGMQLPVLVIAPPNSAIPAALGDVIVVRGAADDPAALQLPLRLFLRAKAGQTSPPPSPSADRAQLDLAKFRQELALLEADQGSRSGAEAGAALETFVADLLRYAGAQVEQQPVRGTERPDIALAVPGAEERLGTVIVEVKASRDRAILRSGAAQLLDYVLALQAGLGVLIYPGPEIQLPTMPMTVTLSLEQLLTELDSRSLGEVLTRARNEAIHRL
jgi:hypothetical protein